MNRLTARNRFSVMLAFLAALLLATSLYACSANSQNTTTEQTSTNSSRVEPASSSQATPVIQSDINSGDLQDELIVRFIDVGQGDAALITCGNQSLLIDGGRASASSKLYAILKDLDITTLDYIIVTHPDADHAGGVSGALNYAQCGTCYCSVTSSNTETFTDLVKYLNNQGVSITVPETGSSFALGGASVTFVGPTKHTGDKNNDSLVVRLDYGNTSFLFEADAEKEAESSMVASGANLKANVLKVAHHGSSHSSTSSFLAKVDPDYAVISVGENSYGHPTEAAMKRITDAGAEILRTDEVGSIIFHSNGSELSYKTETGRITE